MDHTLFDKHRDESIARMKFLASLSKGSHIHLSAICGTGMGSVASLLKQLGFRISGTDKAFYPPMGDVVRGLTSELFEGYRAENLTPRPDLVVIGNNLSKSNPEVEEVLKSGIPYASMPEVFGALLIGDRYYCRTSVVVSGTHGKTTTSAAVSALLEKTGRAPGFFVGGVPLDLPGGVRPPDLSRPTSQRVVVLEGDEYDSAFFAKWPKFLSYRPDVLIVTSLEFDHADIYENIGEIEFEFARLVSLVPRGGIVFVSDTLKDLPAVWRETARCEIITYGADSDVEILSRTPNEHGQQLELQLQKQKVSFQSPLSGLQNAQNLLVAACVGERLGLTTTEIEQGLSEFRGVLRRQTNHGELSGVLLIEDFAHHPTAVELTLGGIRETYPDRKLIAVFEPRSNTTRRGFFQDEYPASFKNADVVLLLDAQEKAVYSNTKVESEPLNVEKMAERIAAIGPKAISFSTVTELKNWILGQTSKGDVLVCMSNGDFGGLVPMLKSELIKPSV